MAKRPVATTGHPLVEMYARWTLDAPIVELSLGIARDYVERPAFFTHVPDDVAEVLADLWHRTGSDPSFPDREKRAAIFGAIFGAPEVGKPDDRAWNMQFQLARDPVLDGAVRYSKRTFDEGKASLLGAFRDRIITLREYLSTFEGRALTSGESQTRSIFERAVRVLKDQSVAGAYGLPPAPPESSWPLQGNYDGKGAHLIEAATERVKPIICGAISRQQFLVAQRIAYDGAQVLDVALNRGLDLKINAALEDTVQTAFTWWAALQERGGIIEEPVPSRGSARPARFGEPAPGIR